MPCRRPLPSRLNQRQQPASSPTPEQFRQRRGMRSIPRSINHRLSRPKSEFIGRGLSPWPVPAVPPGYVGASSVTRCAGVRPSGQLLTSISPRHACPGTLEQGQTRACCSPSRLWRTTSRVNAGSRQIDPVGTAAKLLFWLLLQNTHEGFLFRSAARRQFCGLVAGSWLSFPGTPDFYGLGLTAARRLLPATAEGCSWHDTQTGGRGEASG